MPGARWFPGAKLNFAENLLRGPDDRARDRVPQRARRRGASSAGRQLRAEVARVAAGLARDGIGPGDVVAGFLPNLPEAVIAMLAAASLRRDLDILLARFRHPGRARPVRTGRSRKSCSPRTAISTPARPSTRSAPIAERARAAAVGRARRRRAVPAIPRQPAEALPRSRCLRGLRRARAPLRFERLPFDHPLYMLYSSGTTGVPEVHRPRRRRHAAAAPEGASAAHRREAGRPAVLLHDLRLDDVELARERARLRSDDRALRRLAAASGPGSAVADGRGRGRHDLRHEPAGISRRSRRRATGRASVTASRRCARCSPPARRSRPEQFDFVADADRAGRAARLDLRRHGHRLLLRARQSAAARLPRRAAMPRARHEGRGLGRRRPAGHRRERRTRLHRAVSVHAGRLLERPGRHALPRGLFRAISGRLAPRRLRAADRARRPRDSRPLGCRAESGRRAHRYGRDLPAGRAARPRCWRASSSARRSATTCASCCSCELREGLTLDEALAERIRRQIRANTTPRHVPGEDRRRCRRSRGRSAARWSSSRCARRSTGGRSRTPTRSRTPPRSSISATGRSSAD